VCGVDSMNIYWYDVNGVKYRVGIDGVDSNYSLSLYWGGALVKMLDRWFIETYIDLFVSCKDMICDGVLVEYSDIIEARKMDLI